MAKSAKPKFEEAIGRLEEIVQTLSKGEIPLEDTLSIFEEGVALTKTCKKILDGAERKVEILLSDAEGNKQPRPYPEKGEGEPQT